MLDDGQTKNCKLSFSVTAFIDAVETFGEAGDMNGLDALYLELKIAEGVMATDVDKSFAMLKQLRALGVKISLDDFGTGYSSLSYLKRFPVDTLKIDQSFVRDIATSQDSAAIVKAIISFDYNLNLNMLAEGHRDRRAVAVPVTKRLQRGQGYLISWPIPTRELLNL